MKNLFALLTVFFLSFSSVFAQSDSAYKIKVSSPNGAPALSLASLANSNPQNIDFTYVSAEAIAAEFAKGESDFIIAPVNVGAKFFEGSKSSYKRYKLAAVVTWGNLYFASQKSNFKLKDIKKSEITLFGENTINSSIALFALKQNKIAPKSVSFLAGAANTQSLLLTNPASIVLTAEPALSVAKSKNPKITSYALNDLYKKATGFDGFAQAGLFIKSDFAQNHPEEAKEFLSLAQESCDKCASADSALEVAKAAVALEILPKAVLSSEENAKNTILHCSVRYESAKLAKEKVEATAKIDLAQYDGALPSNEFYY